MSWESKQQAGSGVISRALARSTDVSYITVVGGKHAMLRRHGEYDGLAAQFMVATLLGQPASGVIERVLAGERWLEV